MTADTPDSPLVSVLVRSMDRPSLRNALDSVALQSYPKVEIVVVNARGGKHSAQGASCGPFPLRLINDGGSALPRSAAANAALEPAHHALASNHKALGIERDALQSAFGNLETAYRSELLRRA